MIFLVAPFGFQLLPRGRNLFGMPTFQQREAAMARAMVKVQRAEFPEVDLMASMSGHYLGRGRPWIARLLKLGGALPPGWSDFTILERGFNDEAGLLLEVKIGRNAQSAVQRAFEQKLCGKGYVYNVVKTEDEFRMAPWMALREYLSGPVVAPLTPTVPVPARIVPVPGYVPRRVFRAGVWAAPEVVVDLTQESSVMIVIEVTEHCAGVVCYVSYDTCPVMMFHIYTIPSRTQSTTRGAKQKTDEPKVVKT